MPTLQIEDIPDDVHRILSARAAIAGVSLTKYARTALERAARCPWRPELGTELSQIEPIDLGESAAQALGLVRDDLD